MRIPQAIFALSMALGGQAWADPDTAFQQIGFASYSEAKTYGVYIMAAANLRCPFVRYRLTAPGLRVQTRPLRAGQAQMLRLGAGFAAGDHLVQIEAIGCDTAPVVARRVVLHKASPDHGARALRYIKAHPLGERQG